MNSWQIFAVVACALALALLIALTIEGRRR
jgi:hypothetical protein